MKKLGTIVSGSLTQGFVMRIVSEADLEDIKTGLKTFLYEAHVGDAMHDYLLHLKMEVYSRRKHFLALYTTLYSKNARILFAPGVMLIVR